MKAIFLCEKPALVAEAYDEAVRAELHALTGLEARVWTKAELLAEPERFAEVETVFSTWGMPVMTEEEIGRCLPSLKALFYGAGTVQKFARPFLASGVKVFSAWAANAVPVAEMTVAQIVLANKGYFLTERLWNQQSLEASRAAFNGCRGNYGETVGIIGAGMIGKLVIRMLKAYDLRVLVFDPFLPDATAAELGVEKCGLEELFSRSFAVSNHLANNAETRGMLHYGLFARMRQNATFINTGRGAQVVEADLVRILSERPDLTALLDVTDPEPCPADHPFHSLPNCRLTPHIAGSSGGEVARMGLYMLDEYREWKNGNICRYEVTKKRLETMA